MKFDSKTPIKTVMVSVVLDKLPMPMSPFLLSILSF